MNEKILIVDDNRDNVRLFQQVLTDQGYTTFVALSGHAALLSLAEEKPDMILLDIMMPEMDGFSVCREIKKDSRYSDIPVLFLSARNEMVDEMQGFACGAVDYITKPISVPILLARIRTHLNLKEAQTRLEKQNEELENRVRERTAHLEKILEEKKLLLGEVHHRVLNNLQFVAGLIILQMNNLDNPVIEPLLTDYENRIHSMAMVHQELYSSDDFTEVDLIHYAVSLFRYHAARAGLPEDNAILDPLPDKAVLNINFAIPCGMILNEFFSLCYQHSEKGVQPEVGFRLEKRSEAGGDYFFQLCSTRKLFPETGRSVRDEFSMEVIRILVSQLRGVLMESREDHVCREIRFTDTPPITYSDVSGLV